MGTGEWSRIQKGLFTLYVYKLEKYWSQKPILPLIYLLLMRFQFGFFFSLLA